jgi:hypothetical protein
MGSVIDALIWRQIKFKMFGRDPEKKTSDLKCLLKKKKAFGFPHFVQLNCTVHSWHTRTLRAAGQQPLLAEIHPAVIS